MGDLSLLASRMRAIAGSDHVIEKPEADIAGVRPAVSVAPASQEELAQLLCAAQELGAAVIPSGGGTQQRTGFPPERADLILDTRRLDAILEWEPADLTACLQAGMTLAALQARLAEQGQQLPLDAPCPERATLGGLVATNTSGPRRWLYGSWRDLIIGMHMALSDGTTIKSGGKVVKNVQGYDLAKLFTGSLGTLGVITQINVKLVPLPPLRRLFVASGALAALLGFLDGVAGSTMRASAVDLLNATAASTCGLAAENVGLVLLEGSPAVIDAAAWELRQRAADATCRIEAIEGEALDAVWRSWVNLGSTAELEASEALLSVSVLPSDVGNVVQVLEALGESAGLRACWWARTGSGMVYARLQASGPKPEERLIEADCLLLQRWPATTLTAGDAAVQVVARPWGAEPDGLALMRQLKQRFDPTGTLQPGRYAGGI